MTNQNFTDLLTALTTDNDENLGLYGLRIHHQKAEIGEMLENSYTWVDGEQTDEELDGTCTMGIENANEAGLIKAIKNLGREACEKFGIDGNSFHTYHGVQYVLVRGDFGRAGEDKDELILSNPIVIAAFDK